MEQIVRKLREADTLLAEGTVPEVAKTLGSGCAMEHRDEAHRPTLPCWHYVGFVARERAPREMEAGWPAYARRRYGDGLTPHVWEPSSGA
jgi:hypothetical protein